MVLPDPPGAVMLRDPAGRFPSGSGRNVSSRTFHEPFMPGVDRTELCCVKTDFGGSRVLPAAVEITMNVLVVEDDALLATGLTTALERADYKVIHAPTGSYATAALRAYDLDLVILDLGLPDVDGLTVLRDMRQRRINIPVLVLTARDGVEQQVAALDAGADDYMEKPFDLRELQARVRALLRRSHTEFGREIALGSLSLDPFARTAVLGGIALDLPAREFEVLEALVINAPRAVSKSRLAQRLTLNGEDIGDNAVEVYIHRLRKRLENSDVTIRTARSIGYVIEAR
jgi:two-component system, OmpR family, response regulator